MHTYRVEFAHPTIPDYSHEVKATTAEAACHRAAADYIDLYGDAPLIRQVTLIR